MPEFDHIMGEAGAVNEAGVGLEARQRERSKQDVEKYYKFGSEGKFHDQLSRITEYATLDMITGETELDLCDRCKGTKLGHEKCLAEEKQIEWTEKDVINMEIRIKNDNYFKEAVAVNDTRMTKRVCDECGVDYKNRLELVGHM